MQTKMDKIMQYVIKSNATLEEVIDIRCFLDELYRDIVKLSYLEQYGVDNWIGYIDAMQAAFEEEDI